MNLSGGSATGIAGAVWTNPARTLTGFGGNALFFSSVPRTTIPASGTVVIQPAPTVGVLMSLAIQAASGASTVVRLYDGSNFIALFTVAALGTDSRAIVVTNSCYLAIVNSDAANPAQYMVSGMDFKQ